MKNEDLTLVKIAIKDDESKTWKLTEKNDYENLLKSLKIDNDYNGKNYKNSNKMKTILIVCEILIRSRSSIVPSTISIRNPTIAILNASDEKKTKPAKRIKNFSSVC